MKKRTMIALIVAAALIISGGVLAFAGLKSTNFDFLPEAEVKTYIVAYPFTSIQIDSGMCDVTLVKTEGEFRAVCPDSEKLSCAVIVEDGVLKISAVDILHWTDMIGVFPHEMQITVYLPESRYDQLMIETNTGDVTVPDDFSFTSAEITATTADIHFSAAAEKLLTATVTTGDVTVFGSSPAVMRITSGTGDVILDEITGSCEFSVHTSSGQVQAQNVTCEVMACETSTGDIDFYRVMAQGYLGVGCTTGDVSLEDCDSAEVNIETTTGSVTGHFLTPKWFVASSNTGNVHVPQGREGGQCQITTNTGNIRFY